MVAEQITITDLQILYNYIIFNKSIFYVSAIDILIVVLTIGFWKLGFKKDIFVVSAEEEKRKRKIYKVVAVVSLIMCILTTLFLITNIYLADISARYLIARMNEIVNIEGVK